MVALGLRPGWIRSLVSMAADGSHRLTIAKKRHHLQNHKAQSFNGATTQNLSLRRTPQYPTKIVHLKFSSG